MEEIYEFVTSHGKLTEKHKEDIIKQRGFTEETIHSSRFFSGGKYLLDIENQMVRSFDQNALVASGVFNRIEGTDTVSIATQLLDDRIIIPYLDENRKAYFIRPHKMGLKAQVQIYHEMNLIGDGHSAILTESEFKATAARQLGFKAIGIPGVGSFAGEHFKRLTEFIAKHKIKAICIIFDNEIKSDPRFPNYKDKPINRYDTEYYSYIVAKMLFNDGIETRIGILPDIWRINGKIDIDGALAQGKTHDDLLRVIHNSKSFKAYFEDLPKEAKDIVFKKMQKKYHRSNIHINWGKYVATRWQGKREYEEEISNFIIKILATHDTREGMVRESVLIDSGGKRSKSFSMTAEMMTDNRAFRETCMAMGNFVWKGRLEDLAVIWEEQFFDDDGRIIVEPDHIGMLAKDNLWLFANVAVNAKTGEEYRPDGDGIFWIGDRGYKPVSIAVTTGKNDIAEGLPTINIDPIDKTSLLLKFQETIGEYEAMVALGWVASMVFLEEIYSDYGCFPFLFFTGKRGSGKSTIAEWVAHLCGIEGSGRQIADTTAVAVQRLLGYYSSLPLFLDEYRNNKIIAPKVGMFRNVYNRQSAGKGTREGFGIREGKVRGAIIIAGEETPEDNAFLTRCVVINVVKNLRKENHYNWFQSNKSKFSNYFYDLILRKPKIKDSFMADLVGGKEFFVSRGLDDRLAIHYSIIGSGYGAAFSDIPKEFMEYLSTETLKVREDQDREQAVNVFLDDVLAMVSSARIGKGLWVVDDGHLYIYLHALYLEWADYFRKVRGAEPFKAGAIREYLKDEPGFVDIDKLKRINGWPRRCVVFNLENASDRIKMLVFDDSVT